MRDLSGMQRLANGCGKTLLLSWLEDGEVRHEAVSRRRRSLKAVLPERRERGRGGDRERMDRGEERSDRGEDGPGERDVPEEEGPPRTECELEVEDGGLVVGSDEVKLIEEGARTNDRGSCQPMDTSHVSRLSR